MARAAERLLLVPQVAERLGESERTIRNWARKNLFPGAKLMESPRGPYWMIPESDLKSFKKPPRGRPRKAGLGGV
ncbi:MAG: helix-turn-helix domain-containing protein [Blastocatellia bacterium]